MSSVKATITIGLGECHSFTLVDGSTRALKLLGGNPLRWQARNGSVVVGDLDIALGQHFTSWRKLKKGW